MQQYYAHFSRCAKVCIYEKNILTKISFVDKKKRLEYNTKIGEKMKEKIYAKCMKEGRKSVKSIKRVLQKLQSFNYYVLLHDYLPD